MRRPWHAVAAVVVIAAGCAVVEPPDAPTPPSAPEPEIAKVVRPEPPPTPAIPPPAPKPPQVTDVNALLSEFERLRRLSPAELTREQEAARQAFNQTRTDAARVRFAMTLAVPGTSGTEAAALELLDPLVKNPSEPLHGLAFLLAAYIQEQRRLTTQLQGLQQNVQGLQQNVQGLQQNVQALQQKLDALRTLERSLTERESATPRRR